METEQLTYLVLNTSGLHLITENLGSGLFSLGFVDMFHEDALVLEDVTLGALVEFVVPDEGISVW